MKNRKRHRRGLFGLLLSLVGISATSCWQVCMYGSPCAEWEVKGKVVNEAGAPVCGLQVVLGNRTDSDYYYPLDTLQTDAQGIYQLSSGGAPISNLQVDVKDIDGDEHGAFRDTTVVVRDLQYDEGDGAWYIGHVAIDVPDITLNSKNKQ